MAVLLSYVHTDHAEVPSLKRFPGVPVLTAPENAVWVNRKGLDGRGLADDGHDVAMLVLGIILFGMLIGAGAQLVLGKGRAGVDWTMAIVAGLVGSFVGGLLTSLLAGDGIELRASGIIGSLVGAIIVTAAWRWWDGRSKTSAAASSSAKRSGDPRKRLPR